jgi:predicted nucleic acid-binding protein
VVLIDTNVLVYLLIESDFTGASQELRKRDPDWRSESFILIEFSNVLAREIALREMTLETAQSLLVKATELLGDGLARITHSSALDTAARFGITAYDARFLALARQAGLRLTTEDKQLRSAAPLLTQSIEDALARI